MGIWNAYFVLAAKIWQDYFDGKIGRAQRDAKLDALRHKWGIS